MPFPFPVRIAVTVALVTLAHAGTPSPHQPPQPKEPDAGRPWSEKYAERKQWWCFQPVVDHAPPNVKDIAWPRTDIDRFILAKLEAQGLKPAERATDAALARRLSFALTGLPPSPDAAAMPFDALVDDLLGSPHFGEHWARHWMDVARYAETFGSEHDYLNPHAWRYRDYLVRAFNADLPYDQFVIEQLAGDLLTKPRMNAALGINESLLATAFQRMTEFYATPVDVMREQSGVLDWEIDTVSKAFMGLTIACARCHDHKFDAISTADYYALYGVLRGTRPVLNVVDDPQRLTQHDAELLSQKAALRRELAALWLDAPVRADALKTAIDGAKKGSPLAQLRKDAAPPTASSSAEGSLSLARWSHSSPGLPEKPARAGTLSLHPRGDNVVRAIQPSGFFSDAVSDRHGGSLRSPEFTLARRNVSVLAGGTGKARLRLVVEGCQGDIVLFSPANKDLEDASPCWITMRARDQWLGRRAHIEVMTRDDLPTVGNVKDPAKLPTTDGRSAFGVCDAVVLHDDGAALPPLALPDELLRAKQQPWNEFVGSFNAITRDAINAWQQDRLSDEQALLLQCLLDAGLLPNKARGGSPLANLVAEFRKTETRIPAATRAPGVCDDGDACDAPVFIRGEHAMQGEMVPRRMPVVLGGRSLASAKGDRLALALEITRTDNPLTARVMVNRVWQHLFGRGLLDTPDNLGRMGGKPSHPELLDHLAAQFMRDGWSMKRLIRAIVTSSAWQTSCEASPDAIVRDPDNRWLSHAHSRRLDAEAIRDSLLAVAGNLNPACGGPPIFNHYQEAVDPDKQPASGPLDGGGRRSLYLEVRRNFLNDFLSAFDFPRPNNTTGSRNVTNVPAQGITLLNDPFVHHQAGVWAARSVGGAMSDEARIAIMYGEAFGRAPTPDEAKRALAFVKQSGDGWRELAHAMFNMKEFIHLP